MTPTPTSASTAGVVDPADPTSSSTEETLPINEIGSETLNGFAAGTGVRIEVTGSRTFSVLLATGSVDLAALQAALDDSTARESTDFAYVLSTRVVTGAPTLMGDGLSGLRLDAATLRLFEEAELAGPTVRGAGGAGTWIVVRVRADTYLPGSRVYLVATSTPVIFASAIVGEDGRAVIEGGVPLALLEDGTHRLRLVGTREIGGVEVQADGSVELSDATMTEIARFDRGTTATVRISGTAASGVDTSLVRFVPLRTETPWLLLLIPAAVALFAALARRRGGARLRPFAIVAVVVAAGVVVVIAWMGMFFELMAAAVIVGLLLALLHAVVGRRRAPDVRLA